MSLAGLGVGEIRDLYARGEATPVDVVTDFLAAIDARDGEIGAYLDVYTDTALEEARRLTESGDYRDTPLGGVPVAIKDNICVQGRATTCASKILAGYASPYDAGAVERLRQAGAIVVGKTNLDEFAMGSSTENSSLATTRNPWDPERAPGGSSGGSAAAVAGGMAAAALGSDTGGSIRQPASFCGVVGIKPTYGRVSRYGLVAFASSLDQIGPMAGSVRDAAVVLGAISGHDPRDSTSIARPVPDFTSALDEGARGLSIGIPWGFLGGAGLDAEVREAFERTAKALESEGAELREIELPHADYALAAYYIVANAEASANLARYDGVKYGHRTQAGDDLYAMYTRTRSEGFGAEVKRRILLGTYVLSAGYYDAYYRKAQQVRSLVIGDFQSVFETCDLVMLPTAPTPAFRLGEKTHDPIMMYLSDIFTIPVNLAGLPGVSVPGGFSSGGLPIGVQLVGRALDEETMLRGAAAVERIAGEAGRAP